jgi:hypothetical protein
MLYHAQPTTESYDNLLAELRNRFPQVPLQFIQPRKLRGFGKLKNHVPGTTVSFKDTDKVLDGESLLKESHFFFFKCMSVGLALVPTDAQSGALKPGSMKTMTYPYPSMLTALKADGTKDFAALNSVYDFYNGHFTMKSDQFDYLENTPISNFMVAPGARPDILQLGHNFVDLRTRLTLFGGKDQKITFTLPGTGDFSNIESVGTSSADLKKLFVDVVVDGYVIICNDADMRNYVSAQLK